MAVIRANRSGYEKIATPRARLIFYTVALTLPWRSVNCAVVAETARQ
jgi:hypothetical protein